VNGVTSGEAVRRGPGELGLGSGVTCGVEVASGDATGMHAAAPRVTAHMGSHVCTVLEDRVLHLIAVWVAPAFIAPTLISLPAAGANPPRFIQPQVTSRLPVSAE
jgi:hypothetical protein